MSLVFKSMSLCSNDIGQEFFKIRIPRLIFKSMSICGAKYRILKVVDSAGDPIEGASISITDSSDYEETGLTLADGTYSSFTNGDNLTNPVTVAVTYTGKQPFSQSITMTDRIDWTVQLGAISVIASSRLITNTIKADAITTTIKRAAVQHTVAAPVTKNTVRRLSTTIKRPLIKSTIYDT